MAKKNSKSILDQLSEMNVLSKPTYMKTFSKIMIRIIFLDNNSNKYVLEITYDEILPHDLMENINRFKFEI